MQIDPKWRIIILGLMAVLGVVAGLSPDAFPTFITSGVSANIVKTAGLFLAIGSGVGGAMGLFASSKPGPLAPADSPVVAAATKLAALPETATNSVVGAAKADVIRAAENH